MKTSSLIRKSRQSGVARKVLPFDRITSVLLLMDAGQSRTDTEEVKAFGHELRKKGKEVVFLTYHPVKKLPPEMQPNEMYRLCCRGDFGITGAPRGKELKELLDRPFGLLINGCLNSNEWLRTIAVFSKAQFRVGPLTDPSDTDFYEILIKPNGADLCENYLIETGRFLRKII